MSEFEKARLRAERRLGAIEDRPVLTVPKKVETPKQKGRTNEIEVKVYVNGDEFAYLFKAKITGNLLHSQLTEKNLRPIIKEALGVKFTGVE